MSTLKNNSNNRIKPMLIFLGIFTVLLFSSHFYMFKRISYYLQLNGSARLMVMLLLEGLAFLTLIALPASRLLPRNIATILTWIIYPWMGISLLLFVTLLATDIIWLSSLMIPAANLPEPRILLQHCFGVMALGMATFLCLFALWKGLGPVKVKSLNIALKRLPLSFDGFQIVQITDLHIGPMINGNWLQRVVDTVNELKPDLIVITGDLVDGSVDELQTHVAPLANLDAPLGTFFITGNHEYYSGVEEWCDYVAGLGIRVLRNERVSISAGFESDSFDLAGVDDWGSNHFPGGGPNLTKALEGRNPSKTLILLAHQPAAIVEAATQGVDLQLSGHTHGGQIWPFTYLVYLQQPYTKGLHRHPDSDTQIYISPGTGFWGPSYAFRNLR